MFRPTLVLLPALLASTGALADSHLTIELTGVRHDRGELSIGLYQDPGPSARSPRRSRYTSCRPRRAVSP